MPSSPQAVFKLKIIHPASDTPAKIIAHGRHPDVGEVALVIGAKMSLVCQEKDGKLRYWKNGGFGCPGPLANDATPERIKELLAAAANQPLVETPETYKGQWAGSLSFDGNGNPKVVLTRPIASYAKIALESHPTRGGWTWGLRRTGKWFAGEKTQQSREPKPFGEALLDVVAVSMDLVREACGVRDTHRRQKLDPDYAAQHPAKPAAPVKDTTTDAFKPPTIPAEWATLVRWHGNGFDVYTARGWWTRTNDGGRSVGKKNLTRLVEAAWTELGRPDGFILPGTQAAKPKSAGARGPRKSAFKVLRIARERKSGDYNALVGELGGSRAGSVGSAAIYTFADGSALALDDGRVFPIKLSRGKWRELSAETGKPVEGGSVLDPKPAKQPKEAAPARPAPAPRPPPPPKPSGAKAQGGDAPVDAAKDQAMLAAIAASVRAAVRGASAST